MARRGSEVGDVESLPLAQQVLPYRVDEPVVVQLRGEVHVALNDQVGC